MHLHYGCVEGSTVKVGDHINVFVQPGTSADYDGPVWVINQAHEGEFDEHKADFGPNIQTPRHAVAAYLANYTDGWTSAQSIGRFRNAADFAQWSTEATHRRAPAKGTLPAPTPVAPPAVARWQGGKVARWQGGKVARWRGLSH